MTFVAGGSARRADPRQRRGRDLPQRRALLQHVDRGLDLRGERRAHRSVARERELVAARQLRRRQRSASLTGGPVASTSLAPLAVVSESVSLPRVPTVSSGYPNPTARRGRASSSGCRTPRGSRSASTISTVARCGDRRSASTARGNWTLRWSGTRAGRPMPPGLYFARSSWTASRSSAASRRCDNPRATRAHARSRACIATSVVAHAHLLASDLLFRRRRRRAPAPSRRRGPREPGTRAMRIDPDATRNPTFRRIRGLTRREGPGGGRLTLSALPRPPNDEILVHHDTTLNNSLVDAAPPLPPRRSSLTTKEPRRPHGPAGAHITQGKQITSHTATRRTRRSGKGGSDARCKPQESDPSEGLVRRHGRRCSGLSAIGLTPSAG